MVLPYVSNMLLLFYCWAYLRLPRRVLPKLPADGFDNYSLFFKSIHLTRSLFSHCFGISVTTYGSSRLYWCYLNIDVNQTLLFTVDQNGQTSTL